MKQFEERLDPSSFQRVHRSTIVNIRRLKLSRSYRDRLERILGER